MGGEGNDWLNRLQLSGVSPAGTRILQNVPLQVRGDAASRTPTWRTRWRGSRSGGRTARSLWRGRRLGDRTESPRKTPALRSPWIREELLRTGRTVGLFRYGHRTPPTWRSWSEGTDDMQSLGGSLPVTAAQALVFWRRYSNHISQPVPSTTACPPGLWQGIPCSLSCGPPGMVERRL